MLRKTCTCGYYFDVYPYREKTALYCSRACRAKFQAHPKGYKSIANSLAKMGANNPMYGTHLSIEEKAYLSAITKQRHIDEPTLKRGIGGHGKENPNWRGGLTSMNERIRKSREYKDWRIAVFERDNYTCVWCGDGRGGNLEADHIKPFAFFPSLRFDIDNGRTLCRICHTKTDTYLHKIRHFNLQRSSV